MPVSRGRNGRPWNRVRAQVLAESNVCWICGKPIDMSLRRAHPMSATVDHRIPLSLGGDPLDPSNLAPAHWKCNAARGNGHVKVRTSRVW